MKKADELCRKAMICVTLIILQFSSAFFWLLRVNLKKADELCRKAMICVNFNLPTVFISLFLVTKGDFKKLMNTVGKLTIEKNLLKKPSFLKLQVIPRNFSLPFHS